MNSVATQDRDIVSVIRDRLARLDPEFKTALPQHIPVERFRRVAITAIQRNPELALADQKSLFGACMMAAQDGLLPDGREAALVVFKTKVKVDGQEKYIQQVQYMPMVFGIRKKVYQSGEVTSLTARVAYENDAFDYAFGLNEYLEHKPCKLNPGPVVAAYAIVTYKDGSKEFDVMTVPEIEKVRKISRRSDSGPWRDWYEEMAKKTVLRRLAKGLPLSSDLADFLRRDDGFYDLSQAKAPREIRAEPQTLDARLEDFSKAAPNPPALENVARNNAGGEEAAESNVRDDAASSTVKAETETDQAEPALKNAYKQGMAAQQSGGTRQVPASYKKQAKQNEAEAFLRGWDDAAQQDLNATQ